MCELCNLLIKLCNASEVKVVHLCPNLFKTYKLFETLYQIHGEHPL